MLPNPTTPQLDLKAFIIWWNTQYPFDRYIRKKYNIPFGSPQHRALSHIDMAIEYKEDLIMEQAREEAEMAALGKTTGNQDAKRVVKVSKKQLDADFENLDLRDYDDPKPDK